MKQYKTIKPILKQTGETLPINQIFEFNNDLMLWTNENFTKEKKYFTRLSDNSIFNTDFFEEIIQQEKEEPEKFVLLKDFLHKDGYIIPVGSIFEINSDGDLSYFTEKQQIGIKTYSSLLFFTLSKNVLLNTDWFMSTKGDIDINVLVKAVIKDYIAPAKNHVEISPNQTTEFERMYSVIGNFDRSYKNIRSYQDNDFRYIEIYFTKSIIVFQFQKSSEVLIKITVSASDMQLRTVHSNE